MGGTINNYSKQPSSAVHVFDCRTHTWRDAPSMKVARKRAKSFYIDGKIYVIGGTYNNDSSCAEVFDLKTQTWKLLTIPCDDAKVELRRGKLYVNKELKQYDIKQERWKDSPKTRLWSGSWCFIENVNFSVFHYKLMWYDSERRSWSIVKGLEDFYIRCSICCPHLANYGGKLVILREFLIQDKKSIWCEVIRLEKRIGFSGLEIWGELEQSNNVVRLHSSYKFLSCITL